MGSWGWNTLVKVDSDCGSLVSQDIYELTVSRIALAKDRQ
ncbi:hypothetical protein PI125_g11856 [Phytophthora idaei]|nr:hypothetical protein PI125_g11856 [Phytophthora idaei]